MGGRFHEPPKILIGGGRVEGKKLNDHRNEVRDGRATENSRCVFHIVKL